MNTSRSLVPGSIGAVAAARRTGIAEALLDVEILILVDVSGSMRTADSCGGRTRYEVACQELAALQEAHPGKIGVVAFSGHAEFCASGIPPLIGGKTNMVAGLRFVKPFDGTMRFIVVSDGQPNSEAKTLAVAETFRSHIDTIYVGPEYDRSGARFLEGLAMMAGGEHVKADRATELAARVESLLLEGGNS